MSTRVSAGLSWSRLWVVRKSTAALVLERAGCAMFSGCVQDFVCTCVSALMPPPTTYPRPIATHLTDITRNLAPHPLWTLF